MANMTRRSRTAVIVGLWLLAGVVAAAHLAMHFLNPGAPQTKVDYKARGATARGVMEGPGSTGFRPANPQAATVTERAASGTLAGSVAAALALAAISAAAWLGAPEVHTSYPDVSAIATAKVVELQHSTSAAQAAAAQAIDHAAAEMQTLLEGATRSQKVAAGMGLAITAGGSIAVMAESATEDAAAGQSARPKLSGELRSALRVAPEDLVARAASMASLSTARAAPTRAADGPRLDAHLGLDEALKSVLTTAPEALVAAATVGVQPSSRQAAPVAPVLSEMDELRQFLLGNDKDRLFL